MPTLLGIKQRELRQAEDLHRKDLENAAKNRAADIAKGIAATAGNVVGSVITAGGRVAAANVANAAKDGKIPAFSNRPIFVRQDPAWHGRFLAGQNVDSISFNYPAGFTRSGLNYPAYGTVDNPQVNYQFTPIQHVAYRYVPSVGAGLGHVANGTSSPSLVVETLQNDTATYGINQLWKATRSGNSGSTNYDYAGMGVLIHGLRGFILHAHEIKKLIATAQLNNKSSRGMAAAIAYKSIRAYNKSSSLDVNAELEYIYSNSVNIVAKYNKLMKKFNDFVILPDEFNLFKRTSYIADGVFVSDRLNSTPITMDFYTEEFLLYTDGTFDTGEEGVRLVKKDNYYLQDPHVINVALYILELQLQNIILNQSFSTMFGDIEKKLKESGSDITKTLWHEDLLNPDTVLVPTYDEHILSMVLNLSLAGKPAWDSAWSGSQLGIFEWDGRLVEGYRGEGTAGDANQQFMNPYLFLPTATETVSDDASAATAYRTQNILINSLFDNESSAELLDHSSGTAFFRLDKWVVARNNSSKTITVLKARAAIASRVEIFCTMHVISTMMGESGTLANLMTFKVVDFEDGQAIRYNTSTTNRITIEVLDKVLALSQLEYKPVFVFTHGNGPQPTYRTELFASFTRFAFLPLELGKSWAECDKMSMMAFGTYSEATVK